MSQKIGETHRVRKLFKISSQDLVTGALHKESGITDADGELVHELEQLGFYESGRVAQENDKVGICQKCGAIQEMTTGLFTCSECRLLCCYTHLGKEIVTGAERIHEKRNGVETVRMKELKSQICADCWNASAKQRVALALLNLILFLGKLVLKPFKKIMNEGGR